MSSLPIATREKYEIRPVPMPYPTADLLARLAKEMVVDWQLPSDLERKA